MKYSFFFSEHTTKEKNAVKEALKNKINKMHLVDCLRVARSLINKELKVCPAFQ